MRIAYAGMPGAFGEMACLARFPGCEPVGFIDFATACAAVEEGDCALAMIPWENSAAGKVPGVAALLGSLPLAIQDRHPQPVRLHCWGLAGSTLRQVERVTSHPMALAEATNFIATRKLEALPAGDTAAAAAQVEAAGDPTLAALASERAGELHGLTKLAEDVQDTPDNCTTFVIVAKA